MGENLCDSQSQSLQDGAGTGSGNPNACYDELYYNIYIEPWVGHGNFER